MSYPSCIPPETFEESPEPNPPIQSPEFIRLQILQSQGQKAALYYKTWASDRFSALQVTILGIPERHGFITPGGGWSLVYYKDDAAPSYRALVRKRRKKRLVYIRLDDCVSFKGGW